MKRQRIDVHHHIAPDSYISALHRNGIHDIFGNEPLPEWKEEWMLQYMERFNIAGVVASLTSPGVLFPDLPNAKELACTLSREVNEGFAELKQRLGLKFDAIATLPLPYTDEALKEMEYALDTLHLAGVALFTNYDGHYPGEDQFDEFWAEISKRNAVVHVHPDMGCGGNRPKYLSFPPNFLEVAFEPTRMAVSMICCPKHFMLKYPNLKIILPHNGGTLPYSMGRLSYPIRKWAGDYTAINVAGIENLTNKFWFDTAISSSPWTYPSLTALAGTEKIVFGSDAGIDWVCGPLEVEHMNAEIDKYFKDQPEALEAIDHGNALDLFPQFKPLFE